MKLMLRNMSFLIRDAHQPALSGTLCSHAQGLEPLTAGISIDYVKY